jgi:cytosine/adenosine deaminase-related metal-dependent hydrolase
MRETALLARECGVRLHTHIAETADEEAFSWRQYGVTPIELLDRADWIESDVWLAHCVHLREADITLMARRGTGVAHCPTSNMLLGSGLAPVPRLLAAGVAVGLGVDGSSSNDSNDLRQEVKQAVLSARAGAGPQALSVRQALWMATRGGAACLGRSDIGSIEPGKAADIALFDLDSLPCAGGELDPIGAVVLGAPRAHTVVVQGQVVVRGGQLTRCNVDEIAARQRRAASRLIEKWRAA